MNITTHALKDEQDIQHVLALRRICTTPENVHDYPSLSELPELLALTNRETYRVQLWEDTANTLLAFGIIDTTFSNLYYFVHPDNQDNSLASDIIAWAVEQMRMIGLQQNKQVSLDASCRENDTHSKTLLEQHCFLRQPEQTLRMERPLIEPVPAPQLPQGWTIRPLAGEQEVEAYVALHRAAFGTNHMTVEHRLATMSNPDYRPELDVVAVAPDGTLAAFCVCNINTEANAQSRQQKGEIGIIGTNPSYRNMGLGKAMFLEGLQRLQVCGMHRAWLGTSSSNASAIRLYESVGFAVATRILWYSKAL